MGKKNHHTPTMFQSACEQVFVRAFLDTRRAKSDGTFPVYIRVTYQMVKWLYPTGVTLTADDFEKALVVKNGSSAICKAKAQISSVFTKVTTAVKALNAENNFSFDNLKQALANPNATPSAKKTTLLEYWIQFGESNIISKTPKFTIKQGTRRKEDYIPVSDIVKIRDYEGHGRKAADWWLILYLCNGSNLKDLAKLEWGDDYFYSKELSYVRGKIADKVKVTVHIPITDSLQQFLDKYGTEPEKGRRVFPQILLNATSEAEMESRTHDFNRQIRQGMQGVCAKLGIRPVTASTARNSYITTLTWHGISDAFIDSMVGHVDSKNVLRGYQGTISPKKRLKVNNLLFVDPEIDEDE